MSALCGGGNSAGVSGRLEEGKAFDARTEPPGTESQVSFQIAPASGPREEAAAGNGQGESDGNSGDSASWLAVSDGIRTWVMANAA
jgi:hypothetical protein